MSLPLEVPHALPSAPGPSLPLPSYKHSAPLTPLFATLTKSVYLIDSTPLTRPLFSYSYALFGAFQNPISFPFNRFRTLSRKCRGSIGISNQEPARSFALFQKSKKHQLCFQHLAHSLPKTTGVYLYSPALSRPTLFPYWHLPESDGARRIDLAAACDESGPAARTYR